MPVQESKMRWWHVEHDSLEALRDEFFSVDIPNLPMGVEPVVEPNSFAVWRQRSPRDRGFTAFGLMAPVAIGKFSEDAPPLFGYTTDSKGITCIAAAVFDGMGGAGSRVVTDSDCNLLKPGREASMAYLASRIARRELERLWWSEPKLLVDREIIERGFSRALADAYSELGFVGTGRLSGSMVRNLPTTFASIQCEKTGENEWEVVSCWAGDSRAFVLTPDSGLQQLTSDDVEESDPLEQLRGDCRLLNTLDASRQFKVNSTRVRVTSPALLVVATDGLFHYLPTPGSLEYLLLKTLRDADLVTARKLTEISRTGANDDVSLAVIALGFTEFSDIRLMFRSREAELESAGYSDLLSMAPGEARTIELADEFWQRERSRYVALMQRS